MARRIAINGFGRMGRLTFRALWIKQHNEFQVVAINDPAGANTGALLLEHDSNYGTFPAEIRAHQGHMHVDDARIRVLRERDWSRLDWGALGVHTVLECSGAGTTRDRAAVHLDRGAKLVIIAAPAKEDDATIVMGVNEEVC